MKKKERNDEQIKEAANMLSELKEARKYSRQSLYLSLVALAISTARLLWLIITK